jgi:hypothetical protein
MIQFAALVQVLKESLRPNMEICVGLAMTEHAPRTWETPNQGNINAKTQSFREKNTK